jgi:cytochrome P450
MVGNLPEMIRRPLDLITECTVRYGDVTGMRAGRIPVFLVNHPDLVEEVLVSGSRNFRKSVLRRGTAVTFGQGLLTSDGELWLRQRRLMQPAFHHARIAGYASIITGFAGKRAAGWRDGDVRDIHIEMMELALEIISAALFGAELGDDDKRDVREALELSLRRSAQAISIRRFTRNLLHPGDLQLRRSLRQLDMIVQRIIDQRRRDPARHDDLLAMLLEAAAVGEGAISDKQIRDEVVTMMLTGHETVATSLAWTWYLISQHPEVERKLAAELEEVLEGREPVFDDLPKLVYTGRIIKEAMRLYPPGWLVSREAISDCELAGYRIAAGTQVAMSQWTLHRDGRWFADPTAFNPDRWTPAFEKDLPKFAYFPFGGGARRCIGDMFAIMEANLILATLAQRVRLSLVPGHPVELLPQLTLRPRFGMRMVVSR